MKHWEALAEDLAGRIYFVSSGHPTKDESLKINILRLVARHRDNCEPTCNVTLFLVKELAEKAGLKFSVDEERLFN